MAKAAIRRLKAERFWRWLCVEVYGKPAPKQPIKQYRKRRKFRPRRFERACARLKRIIEEARRRRIIDR